MAEAATMPTAPETQDLPAAHGYVAEIVRYMYMSDQHAFAEMVTAGDTPPSESISLMQAMRAALAIYDTAVAGCKTLEPRATLELALVQIDSGDIEAARVTIKTLAMATDFMRPC